MSIFTEDDIDFQYPVKMKPCAIIIDCRSKVITEQQEEINRWLTDFSKEARHMLTGKVDRAEVDARIITVGTTIEVGSFMRASEGFPELQLKYGTGASLEEAMEITLDRLEERKNLYRREGLWYSKPKLYILSADIVNYCASIAESENRLHCMIRDNKIKFYPIVCLPKVLVDAGKRNLRDGCLPTLQAPLELLMYVSEDFWSKDIADIEDENGSVKAPPTPTIINIGI